MWEKNLKAKVRKEQKKIEEERKRQEILQNARDAQGAVARQVNELYDDWKKSEKNKDYKQALWNLKMFTFMSKVNLLCERYVKVLNMQQTIAAAFSMIEKTNRSFSKIVKYSATGLVWRVKRNIRRFKRQIEKFGYQADKIIDIIDSIFDEKKGRKKTSSVSSEEQYRKALAESAPLVTSYEVERGIDTTVSDGPDGTDPGYSDGTSSGKSDSFGGGIHGIGNPNS